MKNFVIASLVTCLIGCLHGSVAAETTGWSWAGFSSKTTKTDVGVQTPPTKSWLPEWKMPDVAGSMKKAGKSVTTTTNNAWKATTRTTKQAWNKTTEFLDPFPDDKAKSSTASKPSSGSGFSSWFGGSKPVDDGPKTVNDFLGGQRLQ